MNETRAIYGLSAGGLLPPDPTISYGITPQIGGNSMHRRRPSCGHRSGTSKRHCFYKNKVCQPCCRNTFDFVRTRVPEPRRDQFAAVPFPKKVGPAELTFVLTETRSQDAEAQTTSLAVHFFSHTGRETAAVRLPLSKLSFPYCGTRPK